MEWTKIPTDLLTDALQDWELAAIIKYQLLFALKEVEPEDRVLRRHLTVRQAAFVRQYSDSVSTRVRQDIDAVTKERKRQKAKYLKNKEISSDSPLVTPTVTPAESTKADKIREDKIREDKIPPIPPVGDLSPTPPDDEKIKKAMFEKQVESEFECFWKTYIPVKTDRGFTDKGSKKAAFTKFANLLKGGEPFNDIMDGLARYLQHSAKNNLYTCHAVVFLNQERWKNEYEEVIVADKPVGRNAGDNMDELIAKNREGSMEFYNKMKAKGF